MHRLRYRHISEKPPPADTPFHHLPLDFPLSPTTLSHLTTTQLALAWIAPHSDWDEQSCWSLLFAEWRKRRAVKGVERDRGEGRGGMNEDPMDRLTLDWKIPNKLEELQSGPLAALPMHPDFHPLLVEEARRVFHSRRQRKPQDVRSASPLPPTTPRKRTSVRRVKTPSNHDVNLLIPRDFTSRWSAIFIGSVLPTMPYSVVWAMLSPPDLPEPVAISLVPPPRGSSKQFSLCFVAYESRLEAIEACRGLYDFQYGDSEQKFRLVAEMTDKPAHAVAWE
ncbi:hypothetical protein JCM11251_004970 [Rhodosporidiobolus azoricus]